MRHRVLAVAICLAIVCPARVQAASPADVQAADGLFRSGKAALESGDLATACARFTESQRLDPAPGTLLNLAECEQRSGKVATALAHAREARAELAPADFRVAFADAKITELARRAPRLTLKLGGPDVGAKVLRDGANVPATSFGKAIPIDPGRHLLVVRALGHADARVEVALKEKDDRTVELTPGPALSGDDAGVESQPGSLRRTGGIVAGGVGLAGLAVGAVMAFVAKETYDGALAHCPNGPNSCDAKGVQGGTSAHGQAAASTTAFAAGGILLAGGVVLYLTAPAVGAVALAPAMGPTGAGVSLSGAW